MEAVTQEAVIIGPYREALLGPEKGGFWEERLRCRFVE